MRLLILIVSLLFLPVAASAGGVNLVTGDASWQARFRTSPEGAPEAARLRVHLEYVEALLRAADTSQLDARQRESRAHMLDLLREYHRAGVFPKNHTVPGRRPHFIDEAGRICAVGYLVEQTAGRAVAEAINRDFEWAFIHEIHGETFDAWVAASGLSKLELAMIQPSYDWERPDPEGQLRHNLVKAQSSVDRCVANVGLAEKIAAIQVSVILSQHSIDVTVPSVGLSAFQRCVKRAVQMHAGSGLMEGRGSISAKHSYRVSASKGKPFDRTLLEKTLKDMMPILQDCMDGSIDELRATGPITLRLTLDPAGEVTGVKTLDDKEIENRDGCMLMQIGAYYSFQPFAGSASIEVTFELGAKKVFARPPRK